MTIWPRKSDCVFRLGLIEGLYLHRVVAWRTPTLPFNKNNKIWQHTGELLWPGVVHVSIHEALIVLLFVFMYCGCTLTWEKNSGQRPTLKQFRRFPWHFGWEISNSMVIKASTVRWMEFKRFMKMAVIFVKRVMFAKSKLCLLTNGCRQGRNCSVYASLPWGIWSENSLMESHSSSKNSRFEASSRTSKNSFWLSS